jgi:hypothetical protein
MNDIHDFVALLRDGLGLELSDADVYLSLDDVAGWDSVHLLWLLTTMEETTGRLRDIYGLYTAA